MNELNLTVVIRDGIVELLWPENDIKINAKIINFDTAFSLDEKRKLEKDVRDITTSEF